MPYEGVKPQIKFLTGSDTRANVLIALLSGAKNVSELSTETGIDKSTMLHSIDKMRSEVSRDQGRYSLTLTGQIKAQLLDDMIRGLEALEANQDVWHEHEDFWAAHDLSSIPRPLLIAIRKLKGCACIQDNSHIVGKSLDHFLDEVAKAKRVWGVSSVIARGHIALITGLLDGGVEVDLILTPSIIAHIEKDIIKTWLSMPTFRLYEAPDTVKIAFTVTDSILSLGLYFPNGAYDSNQDIVCTGPDAVEWGHELFESYLAKSIQVHL